MPHRRSCCAARLVLAAVAFVLFASPEVYAQEEKSSNAAKAKFSAAAEMQNDGQFGFAIDEYREFLEKFAGDPLATKARHYLGICLIQQKKYAVAAIELGEVVEAASEEDAPEFKLLDETLLNLGTAQYEIAAAGNDKAKFGPAAAAYGKLAEQFPKSKFIATALFNQGESYYAMGQLEKAGTAYQVLLKDHADHKLAVEAQYALGVSQLERKLSADAMATFDAFLKAHPDHKHAQHAKMYKADALFEQEKYDEAEKLYAETAAAENFDLADRAMMRQADCLTNKKRYAEAGALFASVVEKFPNSSQVTAATLAAGARFHLAGKHEDAIKWLVQVKGTGAAEAGHWLARSYLATDKPAEALAAVEEALPAAKGSSFLVDLLLDQADAVFELPDRRKDSIALYAALADAHPQHAKAPVALYYAAWAASISGQHETALQYTGKFVAAHADHELLTAVQSVAADSYLNTSAFDRAEKSYAQLLKDNSKHADVRRWKMLLGWTLYRQNRYDDTITTLNEALAGFDSAESRAEALFLIGSSQFALKKYEQARDSLQQAIKDKADGPQSDEVLLLLSRAQRQLGELAAAAESVQRLIADYPNSDVLDRANYYQAEYLYADRKYQEAAAQYQIFLKDHPESALAPKAMYWLGWSQLGLKDYPAAIKSLDDFLSANADHRLAGSAYFARAQAHRLHGDHEKCVADIDSYLATNPEAGDKSGALFERGLAEMDLKRFAAAVKSFETILSDDPKYAAADKALYQLAWSLKEQKQDDKATAAFQRLASEHADSPLAAESLYHVGEKQYDAKQYDEAAKSYKEARQKAKQAGQTNVAEMAAHKLAWTNFHQKNFQAGHDTFAEQLAAHPNGSLAADARFMAAECLFKLEQHAEALTAYKAVQENPPASKAFQLLALLHAGQAASQLKEWDECIELLESCRKAHPKSAYEHDIAYEIAWARKNKGELDAALAMFQEVADVNFGEVGARARLMMGEIKFEQEKHEAAIRDFYKVFRGYKNGAPESFDRWKAQAAYEAARCFEVLKSVPNAKKYYQEVLDKYPNSQVAALAKQRIEALQ